VIAVARYITADLVARLDHARAFGKLMPDTVDLDVKQRSVCICRAAHFLLFLLLPLLLETERRIDFFAR